MDSGNCQELTALADPAIGGPIIISGLLTRMFAINKVLTSAL